MNDHRRVCGTELGLSLRRHRGPFHPVHNLTRDLGSESLPRVTQSNVAALILAAGQGTRMKSSLAKVLHEIDGEPLVSHPIRAAQSLKAEPIVVVVGHGGAAVKAAVESRFPKSIRFTEQKEQRGTGHAVRSGMGPLRQHKGYVLILYGDVPLLSTETLKELLTLTRRRRLKLAMITAMLNDPSGYGRIVRDKKNEVVRIVEHKDASTEEKQIQEINAGIYAVDVEFLRWALARISNKNAQKEYYLTDIVGLAIREGNSVGTVTVHDSDEIRGVNSRAELVNLGQALRMRTVERFLNSGVTIVNPNSTYISQHTVIGADTVIQPNVHIRGKSSIGNNCHIDTGVIINNAHIADNVTVHAYTLIDESTVAAGAILGPFARLRPGSVVCEKAHVGNFVELKKTKLGVGAKANHLAYLGDSDIGAASNIGAGTITCNYDGILKHRTVIGSGVFIGSNATLVAPLELAAGVYVAAGSTVTDSASKDALVFGRARQTTKPGHAAKLRQRQAKQKK